VKLAIVDVGCGNIGSVGIAFERFGIAPLVTGDAEEISGADKVILPGVGAAGYAMDQINGRGLAEPIKALRQPVLGICLGMQLLFERSEEEGTACLGVIRGAHSYACDDVPETVASAGYGRSIPAVVRSGNWLGAQFHPERSGEAGARFLKAFLAL
jgi:glutamine amidotransferase